MIEREQVERWLQAYVAAWKSYDPAAIGDLFGAEVEYRYHPYDEPIRGRAAVVESWLGVGDHEGAPTPDEPGTYDAAYGVAAVDGDVAVAIGTSTYFTAPGGPIDKVYDNCFLIRFGPGGRCAELTEWFVERPTP